MKIRTLNALFTLILAFALLVIAGCERENQRISDIDLDGKNSYSLRLHLKGVSAPLTTYAVDVSAEEHEKTVSNLSVVFFDPSDQTYLGTVAATVIASDNPEEGIAACFDARPVIQDHPVTAEVAFMLIANMTVEEVTAVVEAVKAKVEAMALTDLTYTDIKTYAVVTAHAPDNFYHFVMVSNEKSATPGDELYGVTLTKGVRQEMSSSIALSRLSARIDVELIGVDTEGEMDDFVLTKVTVKNRQTQSNLFELATASLTAGNEDKEYITDIAEPYTSLKHAIYTYENSTDGGTCLEVNMKYRDIELTPVIVPFTGKAIRRNHIYKVKLSRAAGDDYDPEQPTEPNINMPEFTWTIDVNDWDTNDAEVSDDHRLTGAPVITNISKAEGVIVDETLQHVYLTGNNTSVVFTVETESNSVEADVDEWLLPSWLHKTGMAIVPGSMKQIFEFSADENPSGNRRDGTIRLINKLDADSYVDLTVTQGVYYLVDYTFEASESALNFESVPTCSVQITSRKTMEAYTHEEGERLPECDGIIADLPFTATVTGEGFSVTTEGQTVTVTAEPGAVEGMLTITLDENAAYQIAIPLTKASVAEYVAFPDTHVFARLAEYNVSDIHGAFTDSHKNNRSGYYTWEEAKTACPPGYHLPSKEEFNRFIPDIEVIAFTDKVVAYRIVGDGVARAAYRYELVGNFGDAYEEELTSHLKITGRYLGTNYPEEVSDSTISNESWWNDHNGNDVVRSFPAAGMCNSDGNTKLVGFRGFCWVSDSAETNPWHMFFDSKKIKIANNFGESEKFTVRCVKD